MGLFGNKAPGEPWPLDVLTTEHLISGQVEPAGQKWGWTYFSPIEKRALHPLEITVTAARPTGSRGALPLAGRTASFAYRAAMIALISRGEATDKVWDEWAAAIGSPVAAELFLGPYAVTGTFMSSDGTMSVVLNDRIPVRDATFTRVDGAGDGTPILAPRAVVATALMQTAVVAG
jgi:hypothetical protein